MKVKVIGLDSLLKDLKDFPQAMARATRNAENTTATAVRKNGIKVSSEVFNAAQSRIKKDSRGRDTSWIRRSSPAAPGAIVVFKGGDTPKDGDRPGLQHFKVDARETNEKQKGWAPSYKIKRTGLVKQVKRGFYGVGKLKGRGIFQRQEGTRKEYIDGRTGKRRFGERLVRQTGPSAKQMVSAPEVYSQVEAHAIKVLRDKLIEAVDYQVKKIAG